MSLVGDGMKITLEDLEKITDNFSEALKVGAGSYGTVYRGVYNGQEIAVKKLHPVQGLDDEAFFDTAFIDHSKDVHHKNVVRLIGYCYKSWGVFYERSRMLGWKVEHSYEIKTVRALCFDYMHGGSLEQHINAEGCDLNWLTCYDIIRGTCDGLKHLHNSHECPILHLGLKPANIMLDKNLMPKIGDLGLSKLFASTDTYKKTVVKVTYGHMPPEYIYSGHISTKFDVFSLGVIILKMMAGNNGYTRCYELPRKEFAELVINNWKERQQSTSEYLLQEINILQAEACVNIALRCVDSDRHKRPDVKDIILELEQPECKKQLSYFSLKTFCC